jgi:Protein of unknown function with PCYCGC motif
MKSMNQFPTLALGITLISLVAIGASVGGSRAESATPGKPAACEGDCCKMCPRTSPATARDASLKSSNGITLAPKLFVGPVRKAYTIAEQNPMLLAQLDCYCGCEKNEGHKSLLDCYRSRHGATCQICTNEVLDASRLFDGGMAPEQIKETLRRRYQAPN